MIRKLKSATGRLASGLAAALVLTFAPAATSAQGDDGFAALNAMVNEDGAEAWAICAMASAYMQDGVVDEAENALRDKEQEMLAEVAIARFMAQRGLTLAQARETAIAVLEARSPLYEDGSGTEIGDVGKCILADMVSQDGEEPAARLAAAYQELLAGAQSAPAVPAAPVAQPAALAPAAPVAAPTAPGQILYSVALGQGDGFGGSSYFIGADGTLTGHWSFNAANSTMYRETAVPRVRGQGLAGGYTTSGTAANGVYASTLEITELYQLEGGRATVYRMVWDGGDNTGLGLWLGDDMLGATFGASSIGQFFRREAGDGWDAYIVTDVGGEPSLNQFRFEGGQFEGSHDVLGGENGDRPLGTARFARDRAGVVRIAMPNGQTIVAVCSRTSIGGC